LKNSLSSNIGVTNKLLKNINPMTNIWIEDLFRLRIQIKKSRLKFKKGDLTTYFLTLSTLALVVNINTGKIFNLIKSKFFLSLHKLYYFASSEYLSGPIKCVKYSLKELWCKSHWSNHFRLINELCIFVNWILWLLCGILAFFLNRNS